MLIRKRNWGSMQHEAPGTPSRALYDPYVVAVGQSLRPERAGIAESESSPPCGTTFCLGQGKSMSIW
jgi:hypothetical protein